MMDRNHATRAPGLPGQTEMVPPTLPQIVMVMAITVPTIAVVTSMCLQ